MARLDSWLSADVMHALGWALIHSLWQCLGVAALAAVLMAFSRRPSIRYLVATGALVLMLAAPVATFFVLMKQAAPVHALLPPSGSVFCRSSAVSVSSVHDAGRRVNAATGAPSSVAFADAFASVALSFAGFSSAEHPALAGGCMALRRGAFQFALGRRLSASGTSAPQAIQRS